MTLYPTSTLVLNPVSNTVYRGCSLFRVDVWITGPRSSLPSFNQQCAGVLSDSPSLLCGSTGVRSSPTIPPRRASLRSILLWTIEGHLPTARKAGASGSSGASSGEHLCHRPSICRGLWVPASNAQVVAYHKESIHLSSILGLLFGNFKRNLPCFGADINIMCQCRQLEHKRGALERHP